MPVLSLLVPERFGSRFTVRFLSHTAMLEVTPVTFCQGLDAFLGVFVMQNPASTQQIKMLLALMGLGKGGGSKSVFCLNRKKRSQEGKVKD